MPCQSLFSSPSPFVSNLVRLLFTATRDIVYPELPATGYQDAGNVSFQKKVSFCVTPRPGDKLPACRKPILVLGPRSSTARESLLFHPRITHELPSFSPLLHHPSLPGSCIVSHHHMGDRRRPAASLHPLPSLVGTESWIAMRMVECGLIEAGRGSDSQSPEVTQI